MKILLLITFVFAAQNSTADSLECYKQALTKLSVASAVKLCKQAENLAPIECYNNAIDKVGASVAFSICAQSKSVNGPLNCYQELLVPMGASIASKLCKGSESTATTKACYDKALILGWGGQTPGFSMGHTLAAEICTN